MSDNEKNLKYKSHTDEELKSLAKDIHGGSVFTDRHIRDSKDLISTFLILGLMNEDQHKNMKKQDIYCIYEYLDRAGPRSCNGYPIFFSMNRLNKEDSEKMWGYYKKIKEAVDSAVS